MTSKHRSGRQPVGQVPRSVRDATLKGVQRATIRTGAALLVGGVSGVAWGHLPQTFPMHEVGPAAPVIERGPAIAETEL